MTTILDALAQTVAANGPKPAIIEGSGRTITFDALDHRARSLAAGFQARGIGRGDRVLMAMPVGIELYASLAALWHLGATVVFPEPAMGLQGLRHAARVAQPKAFLAAGWYRLLGYLVPELMRLESRLSPKAGEIGNSATKGATPDDIALISFTSGSTGAPKAIARSHAFMMAQHDAIAPLLQPGPDGERDLVAFPVFVLVCLALGVTSVLPAWKMTRQDLATAAQIRDQVQRSGVTRLLVPPSICETLCESDDLPALSAIFTGGGPVFPDTLQRLAEKQPGLRLVAVYGSTEAEPIAHLDFSDITPADFERMESGGGLLAGHPVTAVDVCIDDGEILVAGDHVNKGYLDGAQNAESKTERDGRIWHHTGDAGKLDTEGRLWLLGRTTARLGGIDPFAVETAARFWPGAERTALADLDGKPVLAVQGDPACLDAWRQSASALGVHNVQEVRAIPLDRRHRSKTDYVALHGLLKKR
ncbi:MAG: AMP-binding protein [Pseudomonadota bacterium]